LGSGFCTIGGTTANEITADPVCRLTDHSIPPLPTPTSDVGAAVLNGTVYVVGGHTTASENGVSTAEALRIPRGL
jgi:hypothetical protein